MKRVALVVAMACVACGSKKDQHASQEQAVGRDASTAAARSWPADAPSPDGACTRHDECAIVRWDGPFPPDPCCDQRRAFVPVLRSYLAWFVAYRKEHCAGVTCPSAPLPGAEPNCCVVLARCVNGKCVQSCDDPTFKPPAEHSLDPGCNEGAIMPEPPAATGPTEQTLTDGGVAVTVTLAPPPGWKLTDPQPNHVAMNNGDFGAPAWVKVLLTCHGACGDKGALVKNIEKVATERFDFTKSDGFVPRLAPVWDEKPGPAKDGVVRWSFHGDAVSGEGWNLHQIAVERIVETPAGARVLECMVEATRQTRELEDQLIKLCAELPVKVGATAAPSP